MTSWRHCAELHGYQCGDCGRSCELLAAVLSHATITLVIAAEVVSQRLHASPHAYHSNDLMLAPQLASSWQLLSTSLLSDEAGELRSYFFIFDVMQLRTKSLASNRSFL